MCEDIWNHTKHLPTRFGEELIYVQQTNITAYASGWVTFGVYNDQRHLFPAVFIAY